MSEPTPRHVWVPPVWQTFTTGEIRSSVFNAEVIGQRLVCPGHWREETPEELQARLRAEPT